MDKPGLSRLVSEWVICKRRLSWPFAFVLAFVLILLRQGLNEP